MCVCEREREREIVGFINVYKSLLLKTLINFHTEASQEVEEMERRGAAEK